MKLSRKALAAVATTFALTTVGLSAPAMAAPTPNITILAADGDEGKEDEGSSESSTTKSGDKEDEVDGGSSDPKEIRDWVAVFTAVVGALSTAFVFIQKLNA